MKKWDENTQQQHHTPDLTCCILPHSDAVKPIESNQAWALMEAKRGNPEEATSLFKKAILKRPRDGAVWQAYALLLKVARDMSVA